MAKLPYMKFYQGDYLQKVDDLSRNAEFAWFRTIIKMHQSPERGIYRATVTQLKQLWKCNNDDEVANVIAELKFRKICEISADENYIEFQSRRMIREGQISEVRGQAGKKGLGTAKTKQKQNENKTETKAKQNPDIEYDNEYDNEYEEKGGVGEKTFDPLKIHPELDRVSTEFCWTIHQFNNPRAYIDLNNFLNRNNDRIDYILQQCDYYKKIKDTEKNPKICNLHTWISTMWDAEDYKKKYQQTQNNGKSTKTLSGNIGSFKS